MSWIPGWDSVSTAEWWSGFYFWVSIACLIGLGAAEVASHRYSERKDELAVIDQSEKDKRHDEDVARLQRDAARANAEAERLKADNLATEKIIQPREFPVYGVNGDAGDINNKLKALTGIKVWVQTVPDFEASRLTVSLIGLFNAVGWEVRQVGPEETGVSYLGIMEGVQIMIRYPYTTFPPPKEAQPDRLVDARNLLFQRLRMDSALGQNFFSVHPEFLTIPPPMRPDGPEIPAPPPRARVPDDTILVMVGMKPISALTSEKNALARTAPHQ